MELSDFDELECIPAYWHDDHGTQCLTALESVADKKDGVWHDEHGPVTEDRMIWWVFVSDHRDPEDTKIEDIAEIPYWVPEEAVGAFTDALEMWMSDYQ